MCLNVILITGDVNTQELVRKATELVENSDSVTRVQRMYFGYVYKSSVAQGASGGSLRLQQQATDDLQAIYRSPRFLRKIGNLVMQIKVSQHSDLGMLIYN